MRRTDLAMLFACLALCQPALGGTFKGDLFSLPEIDPATGKQVVRKIDAPNDPVRVEVKRMDRVENRFESTDLPALTKSFTGGSFTITLPETAGITQETFEFYFYRTNGDPNFVFTQFVRGVVITAGKTTTIDVVVPRPQPVAPPPSMYHPCYVSSPRPALRHHTGMFHLRLHDRR